MKKNDFINFIQLYNLNGLIEPVIWDVKNNGCSIDFVSEDKTLIGTLSVREGMEIPDSTFGVYTTSELLKVVGIMDDTINIELKSIDNRPYNLNFSDKKFKSLYVLAEPTIIPKSAKLKQLPEFDVECAFNKNFIDDYLKAKNGLATADAVAFEAHGNDLKIIVGFSTSQTNRVSWNMPATINKELDTIAFSAEYLKAILSANKDVKTARLQISAQGLMRIQCLHDKYSVEYYLVKLKIN